MDNFLLKIKQIFKNGNTLTRLIYINAGVFIIIRLALIVCTLFKLEDFIFTINLQMPSSLYLLSIRPWTLFTYMFIHYDFLHIIFNMLWLYWFGMIFLQVFNEKQLGALYILGGLAGGTLFILSYNTFPYFSDVNEFSFLIGASASVMAIVFAIAFYRKNFEINLLLIGRVKLIYLAVGIFLLDLLTITSDNTGGHIAHIGGALLGILFAMQMKKGKDLTTPVVRLMDWFANIRKPKPKMKVTFHKREKDYTYNENRNKDNADIDAILDKLKRSGYESLSSEEKKRLFDASKS